MESKKDFQTFNHRDSHSTGDLTDENSFTGSDDDDLYLPQSLLPSSFSFSPAGLLLCSYHFGVVSVLQDKFELPQEMPILGVSAGAIAALAVKFRVPARTALTWLVSIGEIRQATKATSSLVDEVEKFVKLELKKHLGGTPEMDYEDYDVEKMKEQIHGIRIGVTHRRTQFSRNNKDNKAFCYVDMFRDLDDIMAAAVSSCYIPGGTGPWKGPSDKRRKAVSRAHERMKEMEELGYIKTCSTDEAVIGESTMMRTSGRKAVRRESYRDGGLTNSLPTKDLTTIVVCPMDVDHVSNPVVSPACTCDQQPFHWKYLLPKSIRIPGGGTLRLCPCQLERMKNVRRMDIQHEDAKALFEEGRRDALQIFLDRQRTSKSEFLKASEDESIQQDETEVSRPILWCRTLSSGIMPEPTSW